MTGGGNTQDFKQTRGANTVGSGHFFVTVFAEEAFCFKYSLIAASVTRETAPGALNTFLHPDS
jgi:hypothetical protein